MFRTTVSTAVGASGLMFSGAARRCACGAASSSSLRTLSTTSVRRQDDNDKLARLLFPEGPTQRTPSASQFGRTSAMPRESFSPAMSPTSYANLEYHRLHVHASSNNTILTLTNSIGEPLAACSGGSVGFRKGQRSGYEAAYRAAFKVFQDIEQKRIPWGLSGIEIVWNGFGQGREAVFRALLTNEGQLVRSLVKRMTDKTPLKVGGVRPKKRRSECNLGRASTRELFSPPKEGDRRLTFTFSDLPSLTVL